MSSLVTATIVDKRVWAPGLWSVRVMPELAAFEAGQWVNLGLYLDGELVRRSYSLVSAPGELAEFLLTEVPEGVLTPLLAKLAVGDTLTMDSRPQGFFTLKYVPDAQVLWMIATGTGLSPFVSMLRAGEVFERFARVVLVHGVRENAHRVYADELSAIAQEKPLSVVTLVSREAPEGTGLSGRVTQALASGALEQAADARLAADDSHCMLCGNPQMIDEMVELLKERGLRKHRVRKPGHITVESYW